jgi:tetratricopeptide (TPR) repeat protein
VKALCLYYKDSQDLAGHFLKEVFKLEPEHAKAAAVHQKMEQLNQLKEVAANRINLGEYEDALRIYDEALLVDPKEKKLEWSY